ncbi:CirA Outer membrane receptor proteins, mostly Fe transport [Caulobacteraceae bacterium]
MSNANRSRQGGLRFGASLAVIAFSLATAGAAWAQDAAPTTTAADTEVDALVITGFRASLATALATKRQETDIVDAIKAEDIADFPDSNLVEAIQRIPGVSIDRDAGEGRTLTVRGLGPDFTRTRINGMEGQATTGGTDSSGGANRGRGFDFNVFASELFNSVTIRKTASAEVEEGSLGATVDLRTSRPFDYKGMKLGGSLQYGYNDLSEEWDPRAALLYSNTFFDGKIGVLASLAYSQRSSFEEGFSSVRWERATDNGGFCSPLGFAPQNPTNSGTTGSSAANCATGVARPANTAANNTAYTTANQATVFIPRLPRYGRLVHEQDRTGFTGAIQYRPTDSTTISLDVLYSDLSSTRQENFLESLSFSRNAAAGGKTQIHVVDAFIDPSGQLARGTFNNVDVRSEQRYDELQTQFTQYTLTLEQDFGDRFSMRAFLGTSESDFQNPIQTTVTFDRQNTQGYSWDFTGGNNSTPLINYGFDVANPANWSWRDTSLGNATAALPRSEIRMRPNGVLTTFNAAQLDFQWEATDFLTIKFGYNFKKFESDSFENRRADETVVPVLPVGTTIADISQLLSDFGRNLDMPGGNATQWIVPNLNAITSLFNINCNCDTGVAGGNFTLTGITNGNARGGNRFISEESRGYYMQADFRTDIFDMPLRGNFGFRQVETSLYAEGYSSTGGGTLVSGANRYENTLPSLNLALEVTDTVMVRFGAAKVMARPQIGNTLAGTNYLVPTTSLAASGPNFTASIGNVDLAPFLANTYDLSFEWYFAPESLFSVSLFKKDINSYIQIIRQDLQYQELTALNPIAFAPALCIGACTPTQVFQLTSAVNTEGGPLTGFEIAFQAPFSFLPAPFDRFGIQANYTQVKSEIDYCDTTVNALCTAFITEDLVNLSPKAYNATLYYEDDRLSARVSAAYREGYLQNIPGRNANALEGKLDSFNVDAAASWKVSPQVSLTFEGLNLLDTFNRQWVGSDDRQSTSVYHHTGRQFNFGFKYTF